MTEVPQFRQARRSVPALPSGLAAAVAASLTLLAACADTSAALDRKMSQIRREQCGPLPSEAQRRSCIRQVDDIEDDARRRLEDARRRQAIEGTVDQMHVINQSGQGW
ncbi:MAG TPA: hypothetical protein VGM07_23230 [Stellaceae bacterium]|jgi:hypothetical protein